MDVQNHSSKDGRAVKQSKQTKTSKTQQNRKAQQENKSRGKEVDKWAYQSVAPGLVAGVAPHEAGHGFIGGAGLFHVLAEGLAGVAEAALLAGVLVDGLLHGVVEAGLVLLQLRHLVLPDDFPRLLVEVGLLVVLRQLLRRDLAGQHLRLRLARARSLQAVADRVHALVEGLLPLVSEHVFQLPQQVLQEDDRLWRFGSLLEPADEAAVENLQDSLVCGFVVAEQVFWVVDEGGGFLLEFGLAGLLLVGLLEQLDLLLEGDDQFEPLGVDLVLLGLHDVLVEVGESCGDEVQLLLGGVLEEGELLECLRHALTRLAAPLLQQQQFRLHFAH